MNPVPLALLVASSVAMVAPSMATLDSKSTPSLMLLDDGRDGLGGVVLTLDPAGRVISCVATRISGPERLGKGFCKIMSSLSTNGARTSEGRPVYARIHSSYRFAGPLSQYSIDPKLLSKLFRTDIRLASIKKNETKLLNLNLQVAKDGAITACGPSEQKEYRQYVEAACANFPLSQIEPLHIDGLSNVEFIEVHPVRLIPM